MNESTETIVETPFMAQRRKLRELKAKQDGGEAPAEEARTHHPAFKKKVSKKAKTTGD